MFNHEALLVKFFRGTFVGEKGDNITYGIATLLIGTDVYKVSVARDVPDLTDLQGVTGKATFDIKPDKVLKPQLVLVGFSE